MRLEFLGGGREVGRLAMLLDVGGKRLLFDYGMNPTKPPTYPAPAPRVDAVLLSHCHVDHSGMVPWVCGRYDADCHANLLTAEVSDLLIEDSLKISRQEGYEAPFEREDVKAFWDCLSTVKYGRSFELGDVAVTPHSAGHIPGATMFEVTSDRTVLFSGDLHTLSTRLVGGAIPVRCDDLIIEATYAARDHPDRLREEFRFLSKIEDVVARGGIALVPSFAVGRTQEVLLLLAGAGFEVWLDGMGGSVNTLYLRRGEFLKSPKKLKAALNQTRFVKNEQTRKTALKGEVIVTTSGMLDGGPVLNYLNAIRDDDRSAVLLTGYQVEGTNGRMLLEEGTVEVGGMRVKVSCEVEQFDFSAHAGHRELVEFIESCKPERVILCHTDDPEPLLDELGGRFDIYAPNNGEPLVLE